MKLPMHSYMWEHNVVHLMLYRILFSSRVSSFYEGVLSNIYFKLCLLYIYFVAKLMTNADPLRQSKHSKSLFLEKIMAWSKATNIIVSYHLVLSGILKLYSTVDKLLIETVRKIYTRNIVWYHLLYLITMLMEVATKKYWKYSLWNLDFV